VWFCHSSYSIPLWSTRSHINRLWARSSFRITYEALLVCLFVTCVAVVVVRHSSVGCVAVVVIRYSSVGCVAVAGVLHISSGVSSLCRSSSSSSVMSLSQSGTRSHRLHLPSLVRRSSVSCVAVQSSVVPACRHQASVVSRLFRLSS